MCGVYSTRTCKHNCMYACSLGASAVRIELSRARAGCRLSHMYCGARAGKTRASAYHQLTYSSSATARVRFCGAGQYPTDRDGRRGEQTEKEGETFRPSLYTPQTHIRWCRQESFLTVRLRRTNVTPVAACERNNNNGYIRAQRLVRG